MACRVIYKKGTKNVEQVYAMNGNSSILFDSLVGYYDGNKNSAFTTYLRTLTSKFKNNYLGELDNNNEPVLEDLGLPTKQFEQELTEEAKKAEALQHQNNRALQTRLNMFLEQIGVRVEAVNSITDRNGNILNVVAAADMITKTIKVVEGHEDITTLPEEAAHFFVQLLKQNESPLYTSMRGMITNYNLYDQVKEEYSELYEDNLERIADEAIAKLVARHILNNEIASPNTEIVLEDAERLSRAQRWWNRVFNYLKKLFRVSKNPYKAAAYRMLNEYMQDAKQTQFDNPDLMFQASSENESGQSLQEKAVSKLLKRHSDLRKELVPIEDIPGLSMKMVMEGEVEKETYIYTDPVTGKETILGRVTEKVSAEKFAKNKTKEQVEKINNNPRNKHLALGGQKLHGVAQNLVEFLGNGSSLINIESTQRSMVISSLGISDLMGG